MTVSYVNLLNRSFTVIFTEAMQSLKPLKEIQKIQSNKPELQGTGETYSEQIEKWQNAFAFSKELRKYVNKLDNLIVLAGGPNSSEGPNDLTKKSLQIFDSEINSEEFKNNMKSCEPKIGEDPDYAEKIIIWNNAFNFTRKLNEFIKDLKGQSLPIPGEKYLVMVDSFIKKLQVHEDEFLIKETLAIGKQGYKIDSDIIEERSKLETDELVNTISEKNSHLPEYKKNFDKNKENFKKIMEDVKKNELEIKAEKKIIEKKYDIITEFGIDEALVEKGAQAVKKMFPQYMNYIAIGSIAVILGLILLSVTCGTCYAEVISVEEIKTIETTTETIVDSGTTSTTKTTEIVNVSEDDSVKKPTKEIVTKNPATEILESDMMMILVSMFIAPVAARILKEKLDIDITETQISMVVSDGMKSVTMYAGEADKLRDVNGYIPRKYQKALRDKAFNAIKENYTVDKYKDVVASVGSQIFDKAIENAVQSGKLERFPLEKKQVEELIKQSIDAVPQIVEWQTLDPKVKNTFIDGNIRKLLQNTGVNGWSHKALESVFDAEMSKRVLGAALFLKDSVLKKIDSEDPYLKYTSTAIDAILERK